MRLRATVRPVFSMVLAMQLACLPQLRERCRLVTEPTAAPALPPGIAELDALLIRRATEMTHAARELRSAHVWSFRVTFAERTLPLLCDRLERARTLAMAGQIAEAGRKYQALLVASQVVQMAVALHAMAQYADRAGQPGGQIQQVLAGFAAQMEPILGAALSEDPRRIERALNEHPEGFAAWVDLLERWSWRLDEATRKVAVAKLVWDVAFLVVATYQAAGMAAELAAAGRPPMPPLPVLAAGGGAAAAGVNPAAYAELADALRKLIALGALDAGVVVALSKTLGVGKQPASPSIVPDHAQMSSGGPAAPTTAKMQPPVKEPIIRPDVTLSGGRSGERVKDLIGPSNSVVRGGGDRAFLTNDKGQVILDVTRDRVKPVTPGVGFGPKRAPTPDEQMLLDQVLGGAK